MLDRGNCVLIAWDMQVGMAGKASGVNDVKHTVSALIAAADAADVPVIWSRHVGLPLRFTPAGRRRQLMQRQNVTSEKEIRPHMLPGDPEVAFLPGLEPAPHHLVLDKTTPSFFIGTPFESALKAVDAQTLVICGVATERGIEHTARHAMALGYFVVVVEDGVGSFTREGHELGMAFLRAAMPVVSAGEVMRAWRAGASSQS
jgi:nicotinamidase-related amidase